MPGQRKMRPMFVARRSYRLRRLRDGARMLPFLGAFLFVLPLLWVPVGQGRDLAQDAVYLFLAWGGLIGLTTLVSRRLGQAGQVADDEPVGQEELE